MTLTKKFNGTFGLFIVIVAFLYACGPTSVQTDQTKLTEIYPKAVLTMNKGIKWYNKGCYQKAVQFFWDANEQFSAVDLPEGVAASFNSIGNANHHLGEMDEAVLFLNQSLRIYEQLDDRKRQIKTLSDIAAAYLTAENIDRAGVLIERGEKIAQKWNINELGLSLTKGIWLTRKKKYDQARNVLQSALDLVDSNDMVTLGTINRALGQLELQVGHLDRARQFFEVALDADRQSIFYRGIADNLAELGQLHVRQKRLSKGLFYLQRSIKVYALLGDKAHVTQLWSQIKPLADSVGRDLRLTIGLTNRWLEGDAHFSLCK